MKITKATVGRGQVINTGNYESQRFYVEFEAELVKGEEQENYDRLVKKTEQELERLVKKIYINTKIDRDTEFGIQEQDGEIVHQ